MPRLFQLIKTYNFFPSQGEQPSGSFFFLVSSLRRVFLVVRATFYATVDPTLFLI